MEESSQHFERATRGFFVAAKTCRQKLDLSTNLQQTTVRAKLAFR
jgi:hypothetical protein